MALILPVENGQIKDDTKQEETKAPGNDLGYDQFLQLLCAEMQYQDPLEPTSNTEYVAQLATFSQMEAMLNMQDTMKSSNANDLVGKYVLIRAKSSETGATTDVAGFVDYVQKSNNKLFLSVGGELYSIDDLYQVADVEYMEAISLSQAFTASVSKLPDKDQLTLAWVTDVDNLVKVYEVFTSYQRSFIDNDTLTKFTEVVSKMTELKTAATEKATGFKKMIDELPDVDKLTLDDKAALDEVKDAYEKFSYYERLFIDEDTSKKFEALKEKMAELTGESDTDTDTDA